MKEPRKYADHLGRECRKYPPGTTSTEHGQKIYGAWCYLRNNPHCEEWDDYPTFYEWSMANGFEIGARMFRFDTKQPFAPDNCCWDIQNKENRDSWTGEDRRETIARWNRTVNVLREHFGLKPFKVVEVEE